MSRNLERWPPGRMTDRSKWPTVVVTSVNGRCRTKTSQFHACSPHSPYIRPPTSLAVIGVLFQTTSFASLCLIYNTAPLSDHWCWSNVDRREVSYSLAGRADNRRPFCREMSWGRWAGEAWSVAATSSVFNGRWRRRRLDGGHQRTTRLRQF